MSATDPTANLSWSHKIRLLRRNGEHHARNLLLTFVCFFLRLFSSRKNKGMTPETDSIQKILIIKTGRALGDAIVSLVLIPELQDLFPKAKIDLLLRDNISSFFRENSDADHVLEFHPHFLKRPLASWRLLHHLRVSRYDLVIACDNPYKSSFTTLCLSIWTDAPWRAGFLNQESQPFLNIAVSPQRGEKVVVNLRKLLLPLREKNSLRQNEKEDFADKNFLRPQFFVSPYLLAQADRLLSAHPKPVLIFITGHWRRSWPLDSFFHVATELIKHDYPVWLAFGPDDERQQSEAVRHWVEKSGAFGKVLSPQPLPLFTAILTRCQLFISNDCGPYHIAVAVGTPSVGIFLSEDSFREVSYEEPGRFTAVYHADLAQLERLAIETSIKLLRHLKEKGPKLC